jgi:lipopolysaccharide/colanic/teichoic acid biosynthesis glycosyltransferase
MLAAHRGPRAELSRFHRGRIVVTASKLSNRRRQIELALKRAFDIAVSASGLVVCAPILAGVGVAVLAVHGRPALFTQERPGLGGQLFRIRKFRTMRNARTADGRLLPDAERLTPLGRWLRATSLDELPELWNVLVGDMSLVGPRPLLPQYLERYSPEQRRRHEMRPGITGLAQVSGRNAVSWPERLALDVHYVDHFSLALDFEILFRTVAAVVSKEGISAPGEATMPEFMGNEASPAGAQQNR